MTGGGGGVEDAGLDAGDAGGPDAGTDAGSDAGGIDAGAIDSYPAFAPTVLLRTYGDRGRVPVFLWENGANRRTVAVERKPDGGYSIWRQGDFDSAGRSPHNWCASGASDLNTRVGSAFITLSGNTRVGVDDADAGDLPGTSVDFPLGHCARAVAAYLRSGGGIGFVTMSPSGSDLVFERTTCQSCTLENLGSLSSARAGEAVTDDAQTAWFSFFDVAQSAVMVRSLPRDTVNWAARTIAMSPSVDVQLSTSGTRVHAAWVDGQTLSIVEVTDAGVPQDIPLPGPGRLVDLVEGQRSVVAVLEFGDRPVLLIRDTMSGAAAFYRLTTSTLDLRPTVAHLKTKLRLAGLCDGGTSCSNPYVEFDRLPDGGAW